MVGRTDRIEPRKAVEHWKVRGLDFSKLLYQPEAGPEVGRYCQMHQDHGLEKSLDITQLLSLCAPALDRKEKVRLTLPIRNVHRVVGTITGSELTRRYGAAGLPEDTIHVTFTGHAGQSFGAFLPPGMTFVLDGDANDYVGKGLSGGKLILHPPAGSTFAAEHNMIVGNVALYGATAGEVYIRGMAGERFAVRNSGVTAVVEAVGDHGCEYMTGGKVAVLGTTGRNFAAGMSGGVAYLYDEHGDAASRCNLQMSAIEPLDEEDAATLKTMLENHAINTRSTLAATLLRDWSVTLPRFVKVMPKDYKRVLSSLKQAKANGLTGDDALNAAFEANSKDAARVGGG
jgi:glutamate synthase (ferredoxin)